MSSLDRRIDRIEGQLEPEKGPCLRFPDGTGGFIEVPGCRDLNDAEILIGLLELEAGRITERLTNEDDRIGQKPTE